LAINRDEINKVIFHGLGQTTQYTIHPTASFYKEEWGQAYNAYDPDEASRLLDEMGLTEFSRDGFRLLPDGKELQVIIECRRLVELFELVKEFWEDVGVKTMIKFYESSLLDTRRGSSNHETMTFFGSAAEEIINYLNNSSHWGGGGGAFSYAYDWGLWLGAYYDVEDGVAKLEDFEGGKLPGEEPPEEWKELNEWVRRRSQVEMGTPEYIELSQKIFDYHAENVLMIGTISFPPMYILVNNKIGNVPKLPPPGSEGQLGLQIFGLQMFYKE
jgi:peptide/nickel transport system substrate-binding protein